MIKTARARDEALAQSDASLNAWFDMIQADTERDFSHATPEELEAILEDNRKVFAEGRARIRPQVIAALYSSSRSVY